jgi:signal peptide peptidase SppA
MKDYSRLAGRVFNTPLLATPECAASVADYLAARIAGEAVARGPFSQSASAEDDAPYSVDADGIATISVHGELVNRGSQMDALSGLTSYSSLRSALTAAKADPRVRGIALDIDSPGGEAAGAMEAAAFVRSIDKSKPVIAYVDSLAASAAYAIASGAREIIATPSATLGSIGVVFMHLDRSQAMKDRGVKPTLLHAGAYKVDGNSMAPLPDDARARIQSQIDEVYSLFTETVGKHRAKLGAEGARATEAGVFLGQRAVDAGLADRIGDIGVLKSAFPRKSLWSAKKMTDEPVHTQAALDAALSSARVTAEAQLAAAVAQARTAERERIRSILDGEPAKDRASLARHLALSSDMAPEAAATVLAAAAAETPPAPPEPSRMSRVPAVDIRPGATQRNTDPQAEADASWSDIVTKLNARLPAVARRA